jgi:anti-sigma-28 factor FlgM
MDDRLDCAEAIDDLQRARLRRDLWKKVRALPEVREAVVNALQRAVASRTYEVRDTDIADAICREMRTR